ncbi:hypothetical protein BW687_009050 [Pseudomonas graminis]|uniref:hypothetical protein n=1 Tax=Pseudomonas graminis TaxID=158627 RepID=UPI00234A5D68|nr:hypothetical protein [Pseudomonas graminis]MDC6380321.1 hypothetical protein [Pseudomonas graminis]
MWLLPSRFLCLVLLLVAGLMVLINLDSLWSQSVDLAHHYALTYRISEQFHLVDSNDPTLGEMNYYPRLSHIFAAILGWPLNSNLLGMQVVTLLSLGAIWGGFVYLLNTLPKPLGWLSTAALAAALLVNRFTLKLEVHGAEVVSNFFYSQLVAQAIIVLAIAGGVYLEAKKGRWAAYVFLIGVIALNTGVHLLPTLELLAMVGIMVLFNGVQDILQKKSRATALAGLVVPVIALCGVVLNPAFSAMRKIAENDGGLELQRVSYPLGLGTLCVLALVISVGLIIAHMKPGSRLSHPAIKYIALYGAGVSALCLLQMVLVKFGFGSNYAVKKYGFGIISYLFVAIAIVAGEFVLLVGPKVLTSLRMPSAAEALIAGGCLWVIIKSAIMPYQVIDFSELLQTEKKITNITPDVPKIPGKANAVIGLAGYYKTFNYMFSLALAQTPRSLAIPDILLADKLGDYSNYGYIVSSAGSAKYDMIECEVSRKGGVTINNASCIAEQLKQTYVCKNTIDFSSAGLVDSNRVTGFGDAESDGRWINGKVGTYTCDVPKKAPETLDIKMQPFLTASLKSQRIKILANGQPVYEEKIDHLSDEPVRVQLPAPDASGKLVITFETPDATSPKQLGVGQDDRTLGFSVKSITFK